MKLHAVFATLSVILPVLATPKPPQPQGLNDAAKAARKKYFGSATDNPELVDAPYVAILSDINEFGQLSPANSMKWENIEPFQDVFNFTGGDQIVQLAQSNGQLMRGHNCVWYQQLAPWVTAQNWTASELTAIIQNHCGTIVNRYAGQIYSWDVINEALNDDGTFREDVFYNTLGTEYIPIALKAARKADPHTKLYINDYNTEGFGNKSDALLSLVKQLKSEKVPIDGIGFQCHFEVGGVPPNMTENLKRFIDAGVEVAITELDIRMMLPETDALLQQQKEDYQTVISACNSLPDCIGVTVWDYTDKYSWVPSSFPGWGAACPWDENLEKKPAWDGIIAGFK